MLGGITKHVAGIFAAVAVAGISVAVLRLIGTPQSFNDFIAGWWACTAYCLVRDALGERK